MCKIKNKRILDLKLYINLNIFYLLNKSKCNGNDYTCCVYLLTFLLFIDTQDNNPKPVDNAKKLMIVLIR